MERFRKQQEEFDREWERAKVWANIWATIVFVVTIAVLSGAALVIYKILVYFGIW